MAASGSDSTSSAAHPGSAATNAKRTGLAMCQGFKPASAEIVRSRVASGSSRACAAARSYLAIKVVKAAKLRSCLHVRSPRAGLGARIAKQRQKNSCVCAGEMLSATGNIAAATTVGSGLSSASSR